MGYMNNLDLTTTLPEPVLKDCMGLIDFAEFSGESLESVVERVRAHHQLTNEDFNEILSRSENKEDAVREFYAHSVNYVYDILGATNSFEGTANKLNKFLPGIMQGMKDAGPKFLEFGGGTGLVCHIMRSWANKEVTYVDVDGYVAQFAEWRFKKYHLDIEMILVEQDNFQLEDKYDVIFTDAVWEHLTPTQQLRYASKLANSLNLDGLFVLIVDLSGECDRYPMHFRMDVKKTHQILQKEGLINVCGGRSSGHATIWQRPGSTETSKVVSMQGITI